VYVADASAEHQVFDDETSVHLAFVHPGFDAERPGAIVEVRVSEAAPEQPNLFADRDPVDTSGRAGPATSKRTASGSAAAAAPAPRRGVPAQNTSKSGRSFIVVRGQRPWTTDPARHRQAAGGDGCKANGRKGPGPSNGSQARRRPTAAARLARSRQRELTRLDVQAFAV